MHSSVAWFVWLALSTTASATVRDCPIAAPSAETRITATCTNKTSCAMDDMLDIKIPADALPLHRIELCVASADTPTPLRPLEIASDVQQGQLSVAIGRQVEAQLPPATGADASAWDSLLRSVRFSTGLPIQVVFTTAQGEQTGRTVHLDISRLWTGERLRPILNNAACDNKAGCKFGDRLTLTLSDYPAWTAFTKPDLSKLQLVLQGERIPGLAATATPDGSGLTFRLARDPAKPEQVSAWAAVLRAVDRDSGGAVSVGVADDKGLIATNDKALKPLKFGLVDRVWWTLVPAFLLFIAAIALWDARKRHHWLWLRDGAPIANDAGMAQEMPFSLGRCQMFAWTLVILFSLLFIAFSTGDWNSFNATALVLMGLGAGTVLGSVAAGLPADTTKLVENYKKLLADPASAAPDKSAARQTLLDVLRTKSLWSDLTGSEDANRTGLHRLQNLVFTLALIGFFLCMVVLERTMPDLSSTQLALLGISSGAYLGFKASGK